MSKSPGHKIRIGFFIILFILFLLYAGFESIKLIAGPSLEVQSPENGSYLQESSYILEGQARNVSFISINDRQTYTDKEGHFREKLIAIPGYNIITIKAKDRFGREISKRIEIFLKEENKFTPEIIPPKVPINVSTTTATSTLN